VQKVSSNFLDLHPDDPAWGHNLAKDADGLPLHYVQMGEVVPGASAVCLLHGWPGFWYDWRRVLPHVAPFALVIAPDLRGFGKSAKPDWPPPEAYSPLAQAKNIMALLNQLELETVVIVGYDVGGRVAQSLIEIAPERVKGLVLGDSYYPGFGTRPLLPQAQAERWYQHFHNIPQAEQIIGRDRETVRLYLSYFYDHWLGNKGSLRPKEFEFIVESYAQPDTVRGSIAFYRAGAGSSQAALLAASQPPPPPLTLPTVIVWGELDPVLPVE
jgi:pimeloyl-ACP methyl ester carboxylesterase